MNGRRLAVLVVTVFPLLLGACAEDPLSLGSENVPGAGVVTRDVTISVSELSTWRDTTLTGFARPSTAPFVYVSAGTDLSSRGLARFNVPDTVRTFVDTLPVAMFEEVEFELRLDTIRSEFTEFPITVKLVELGERFEPHRATWQEAAPGIPWTEPGGSLGVEIASAVLEAASDTVLMRPAVAEDSLMKAWQREDGGNGFAIVVDGPETKLRVTQIVLRYDPTLVGRSIPVPQSQFWEDRAFILDPPPPPTGTALRVGGLPASRIYFEFVPPGLLGEAGLEGATVSQAEVILYPLAAPDLYAAERTIQARKVSLLGDPFEVGEKTPIGSGDLATTTLDPARLREGEPVRLDITRLMAQAVQDSLRRIRIGFRADPDAQALGYWEFGSAESPPELRPRIRVVFSSAPDFTVP
ncbi:MAG: hypothetical protein F4Z72_07220 [Gemmatimonadales bacterium]|uniref:hypothetical protein n=1 Tax=Candidatus Palauibacter irciniicola TaxID=3056733 RepID=UPI00137C961D|nr:hypothetical protein [Candidatus Palauibacter irciniicola]MYC19345.1 hypothetical protein [Gemmatimonadales bacterium]